MCGRYAITLPPEAVRAFFGYVEQPNFPPRYNIAPSQPIPIVRREESLADPSRHFRLVRWGFVPAFVKDLNLFRPIVNARSEGLADKPSYRNAFRRRRCLIIADGFYEWQHAGKEVRPYLIRRPGGEPFGLAGLYETWIGADGSEIDTACIVTTDANGPLSGIHHRMPVTITPDRFDLWLDPDESVAPEAARLLKPAPDETFEAVAIGPAVNKVVNDEASIQMPLPDQHRPTPATRTSSEAQGSLF